ncbi:hypothetical protein SARC_04663 [Sphaeroforma arctica JP610]|uniref:Uncharacterized protein n=1 Tax=Sphaeroforma arctica JP610 TaxID=667725 RepID=A0A0L0G1X9_9EUKA|nr:hypothetical protein SARC_04663 [Sphaeroforma arctica JP610]KNC83070.1 hypothetical protein SARC_04663 [Sphaeroforma arctica JP610]|eukprot:XP_014156972.1 hypothetical protein SARC_04663 [Sphaeroforma arctica JP610]
MSEKAADTKLKRKALNIRVSHRSSLSPISTAAVSSPKSIREHIIIKRSWTRVIEPQSDKNNTLLQFVKTFYKLLFDHLPVLETVFNSPDVQSKYLALTVALTVDKKTASATKRQQIEQEYMTLNKTLGIYLSTQVVIGRVLLLTLKETLSENEYCIKVRITWVNRLTKLIFCIQGEGMGSSIKQDDVKTLLQSTEVSNDYFLASLKQGIPMCPGIGDACEAKKPMFRRGSKKKRSTSLFDANGLVEGTPRSTTSRSPKMQAIRKVFPNNSYDISGKGTLRNTELNECLKSVQDAENIEGEFESSKVRADGTTEFYSSIPMMETVVNKEYRGPLRRRASTSVQRAMKMVSALVPPRLSVSSSEKHIES